MNKLKRAAVAVALLGFAGAASASDLQMCFAPGAEKPVERVSNLIVCVWNALVE